MEAFERNSGSSAAKLLLSRIFFVFVFVFVFVFHSAFPPSASVPYLDVSDNDVAANIAPIVG